MIIDLTQALGNVKRSLSSGERDGVATRVITVCRTYAASSTEVWSKITDSESLSRWFLPVSGDLVEGGTFAFTGNASGTILSCNRPSSFEVTWEFGGQVSWVNVSLEAMDDSTTLTLQHSAVVPEEFWTQYGPGAVGIGWDLGLMGLDFYLSGSRIDPQEGMQWPTTPEGQAYVAKVSDDWVRASIEAGTPVDEAEAAGKTVYAFYTGT